MKELGLRRVELWLDEALYDRVGQAAAAAGQTRARLLRELIDNWAFAHHFLTNKELGALAREEMEGKRR